MPELLFLYRVTQPIRLLKAQPEDYVLRRIGDRWPLTLLRHFGPAAIPDLRDQAEVVAVQWEGSWYEVQPPQPPLRVLSLRRRWASPELRPIGFREIVYPSPPADPEGH
jgi:hypothetical protein